jgi:phosphoribosylaminoimidazolecarboxamide formyltransferase/IMP cyclohydrolase
VLIFNCVLYQLVSILGETKMPHNDRLALISVFDKTEIAEFGQKLSGLDWKIISSGGTAKALEAAGVPVTSVQDMVNGIYRQRLERIVIPREFINRMIEHDVFCSGAILKHRVATLRPEIHGPIISDLQDSAQTDELAKFLMPIIDMVVCDFYPLSEAIAAEGATVESVVELTDIGGPTMIRSAAKGGRITVCRFEDRAPILRMLEQYGDVPQAQRQKLRARAEFEVAKYCMASAKFHGQGMFDANFFEDASLI